MRFLDPNLHLSEPAHRGTLIAFTNVTVTIGISLLFVLNTLMPWRMVGLFCMFIPIVTIIAMCFVSV